jgi:hypothetical protein
MKQSRKFSSLFPRCATSLYMMLLSHERVDDYDLCCYFLHPLDMLASVRRARWNPYHSSSRSSHSHTKRRNTFFSSIFTAYDLVSGDYAGKSELRCIHRFQPHDCNTLSSIIFTALHPVSGGCAVWLTLEVYSPSADASFASHFHPMRE